MRKTAFLVYSLLVLAAGCSPKPQEPAQPQVSSVNPPPPNANTTESQPPQVPVVAELGVGKKAASIPEYSGIARIYAQPVRTFYQFKERTVFEIQIPQAMSLYNATEGKNPASHEEFMTKIIKFNRIVLPELPAGAEYRYHPDDAQLWVEPIAAQP